jgi:hypothetical protein
MVADGSSGPDRGFLRPGTVRVPGLEMPGGLSQSAGIAGALVLRDSRPVERLRGHLSQRGILGELAVPALRVGPVTARPGRMGQAEPQLRQEVGRRQVALEAMPLRAFGVVDGDSRRPLDVETLERLRLLLGVGPVWDEVLGDEGRDLGVGIDLGFQPSACPSHGGGGEVEEQRFAGLTRGSLRRFDVSLPLDFHRYLLLLR